MYSYAVVFGTPKLVEGRAPEKVKPVDWVVVARTLGAAAFCAAPNPKGVVVETTLAEETWVGVVVLGAFAPPKENEGDENSVGADDLKKQPKKIIKIH